jgi:hypothetical protein
MGFVQRHNGRVGSIVPALAKSARTGHPEFWNGKEKHGKDGAPSSEMEQMINPPKPGLPLQKTQGRGTLFRKMAHRDNPPKVGHAPKRS